MISREDLRKLASFECQGPNEFAISFYFQPSTPQDKSHREEAILAKDLVRKTIQKRQFNGRHRDAIANLEKVLHLAESLHGNQPPAKPVSACPGRQPWRKSNLPPAPPPTRLFVNRHF